MHSGSLDRRPAVAPDAFFEPVGSTDTELVFRELLSHFARPPGCDHLRAATEVSRSHCLRSDGRTCGSVGFDANAQTAVDESNSVRPLSRSIPKRPRAAPPRRLEVLHRTTYRYEKAVERSTRLLRFEPMTDRLQRLARHELRVSVEGKWRDYTDVFGNRAPPGARRAVQRVHF